MWANEPNNRQTGDPRVVPTTAKASWFYSIFGCVIHRKWFRIRSWKPKYSILHTEQVLPSYLAPPILPWQPTLMNWNCGGYLKSLVSKCALLCCWRFSFSSWWWFFPLNHCGFLGPSRSDCEMGFSYLSGFKGGIVSFCFLGHCHPFRVSYFDFMSSFSLNGSCLSIPPVCPQVCRGNLCVGPFSFRTDKSKSSCPVALNFISWMTRPVLKWWDTNGLLDYCRERAQVSVGGCLCVSLYFCHQHPPWLSPQAGSIIHMSVSFSYKYLALFTDTGHLFTASSDLQVGCTMIRSAVLRSWGALF